MRLKMLKLKNFRSYRGEISIPFEEDLTAFIGRNDVGKSSILDALAIFFDSPLVKLEPDDLSVRAEEKEVRIGCVFSDLPSLLTLDAGSETSLADEYLLNGDGDLEIHKTFDCSLKNPKPRVLAVAKHPAATEVADLLLKKNGELKKLLEVRAVSTDGVDQRRNPSIRHALWEAQPDLQLQQQEIELNKEDAKKIWDQLQKQMPVFALFRADRPSKDDDSEVQDPMKVAVRQALAELEDELRGIQDKVQSATLAVADRTLEKLKELDPDLAKDLSPVFRTEPKWDSIFKLALTTEDEIPVNKRGSGVRRLILLGFFRAEADRRRAEEGKGHVIYAIEEPETSQHPSNQRMVIEALKDLGASEGCQVVLTTHVPGLAERIPTDSLRYVRIGEEGMRFVESGNEGVLARVAEDLGVIPDNRVRVFVCVEGPNDVVFLENMFRLLADSDGESIGNVVGRPEVVLLPLGGSTLRDWVNAHYLRPLGRPEIHIYDRGSDEPPRYHREVERVNAREDGSQAFLTAKAEAENYLHSDAIKSVLGVEVEVTDENDVPAEVARAVHSQAPDAKSWDSLDEEKKRKKESRAKQRLNAEVARAMTLEMLRARGAIDELRGWVEAIGRHVS